MHFFFYFRAKEPVRIGFRTFRNIDAFQRPLILETDYKIISRVGHVEARATIGHLETNKLDIFATCEKKGFNKTE